ncbi:zinc/iron permease [Tieghemostelium lacteum]|uniref:Zinc/iron permease n=1 Tax=Tieghemostelium lacteum TaxID=361077 RepID=A0A151ZSK9_TIELA|nr:zinc/iron permease [Tieghemostelium lacteum]|eukprot:KYQ96932.1 zinc/iron permease [Tieghemostelium lacteum]
MGSISVFTYSILAGIAPLVSASIPFFTFKDKNINPKVFHHLLCISAGLLFSVATLELIPESIELVINENVNNNSTSNSNIVNKDNLKNIGDDHQHGNEDLVTDSIRYPMIGIALGYLLMIIIEAFMSSRGGAHSHSHLPNTSKNTSHKQSSNIKSNTVTQNLKKRERIVNSHDDIVVTTHQDINELSKNETTINIESNINNDIDKPLLTSTSTATSSTTLAELDIEDGSLNHENTGNASKISLTTFIALATHSFVDGIVISSAFKSSLHVGARVALAIVLHKIPDGLVLSSIVLSQKNNFKSDIISPFYYFLMISLMTPLGSFLCTIILGGITNSFISFTLGFGSGTFLYITSTAILPEIMATSEKKPLSIVSITLGYLLFIFIDASLHSSH